MALVFFVETILNLSRTCRLIDRFGYCTLYFNCHRALENFSLNNELWRIPWHLSAFSCFFCKLKNPSRDILSPFQLWSLCFAWTNTAWWMIFRTHFFLGWDCRCWFRCYSYFEPSNSYVCVYFCWYHVLDCIFLRLLNFLWTSCKCAMAWFLGLIAL